MQVKKHQLELDMQQQTGSKSGKESVKAAVSCHPAHLTYEYQTTLAASWEICMQVKKQQLEPDMEQWTGSKLGKEYIKAVYCHPAWLISIQNTWC